MSRRRHRFVEDDDDEDDNDRLCRRRGRPRQSEKSRHFSCRTCSSESSGSRSRDLLKGSRRDVRREWGRWTDANNEVDEDEGVRRGGIEGRRLQRRRGSYSVRFTEDFEDDDVKKDEKSVFGGKQHFMSSPCLMVHRTVSECSSTGSMGFEPDCTGMMGENVAITRVEGPGIIYSVKEVTVQKLEMENSKIKSKSDVTGVQTQTQQLPPPTKKRSSIKVIEPPGVKFCSKSSAQITSKPSYRVLPRSFSRITSNKSKSPHHISCSKNSGKLDVVNILNNNWGSEENNNDKRSRSKMGRRRRSQTVIRSPKSTKSNIEGIKSGFSFQSKHKSPSKLHGHSSLTTSPHRQQDFTVYQMTEDGESDEEEDDDEYEDGDEFEDEEEGDIKPKPNVPLTSDAQKKEPGAEARKGSKGSSQRSDVAQEGKKIVKRPLQDETLYRDENEDEFTNSFDDTFSGGKGTTLKDSFFEKLSFQSPRSSQDDAYRFRGGGFERPPPMPPPLLGPYSYPPQLPQCAPSQNNSSPLFQAMPPPPPGFCQEIRLNVNQSPPQVSTQMVPCPGALQSSQPTCPVRACSPKKDGDDECSKSRKPKKEEGEEECTCPPPPCPPAIECTTSPNPCVPLQITCTPTAIYSNSQQKEQTVQQQSFNCTSNPCCCQSRAMVCRLNQNQRIRCQRCRVLNYCRNILGGRTGGGGCSGGRSLGCCCARSKRDINNNYNHWGWSASGFGGGGTSGSHVYVMPPWQTGVDNLNNGNWKSEYSREFKDWFKESNLRTSDLGGIGGDDVNGGKRDGDGRGGGGNDNQRSDLDEEKRNSKERRNLNDERPILVGSEGGGNRERYNLDDDDDRVGGDGGVGGRNTGRYEDAGGNRNGKSPRRSSSERRYSFSLKSGKRRLSQEDGLGGRGGGGGNKTGSGGRPPWRGPTDDTGRDGKGRRSSGSDGRGRPRDPGWNKGRGLDSGYPGGGGGLTKAGYPQGAGGLNGTTNYPYGLGGPNAGNALGGGYGSPNALTYPGGVAPSGSYPGGLGGINGSKPGEYVFLIGPGGMIVSGNSPNGGGAGTGGRNPDQFNNNGYPQGINGPGGGPFNNALGNSPGNFPGGNGGPINGNAGGYPNGAYGPFGAGQANNGIGNASGYPSGINGPYGNDNNNNGYPFGGNNSGNPNNAIGGGDPYGFGNNSGYPSGVNGAGAYPYGGNAGGYPYGGNASSYPYGGNASGYPYGGNGPGYEPTRGNIGGYPYGKNGAGYPSGSPFEGNQGYPNDGYGGMGPKNGFGGRGGAGRGGPEDGYGKYPNGNKKRGPNANPFTTEMVDYGAGPDEYDDGMDWDKDPYPFFTRPAHSLFPKKTQKGGGNDDRVRNNYPNNSSNDGDYGNFGRDQPHEGHVHYPKPNKKSFPSRYGDEVGGIPHNHPGWPHPGHGGGARGGGHHDPRHGHGNYPDSRLGPGGYQDPNARPGTYQVNPQDTDGNGDLTYGPGGYLDPRSGPGGYNKDPRAGAYGPGGYQDSRYGPGSPRDYNKDFGNGPGGYPDSRFGPGGYRDPRGGPGTGLDGYRDPRGGPGVGRDGYRDPKGGPGGNRDPRDYPGGYQDPRNGAGGGGLRDPRSGPGNYQGPRSGPGGIRDPRFSPDGHQGPKKNVEEADKGTGPGPWGHWGKDWVKQFGPFAQNPDNSPSNQKGRKGKNYNPDGDMDRMKQGQPNKVNTRTIGNDPFEIDEDESLSDSVNGNNKNGAGGKHKFPSDDTGPYPDPNFKFGESEPDKNDKNLKGKQPKTKAVPAAKPKPPKKGTPVDSSPSPPPSPKAKPAPVKPKATTGVQTKPSKDKVPPPPATTPSKNKVSTPPATKPSKDKVATPPATKPSKDKVATPPATKPSKDKVPPPLTKPIEQQTQSKPKAPQQNAGGKGKSPTPAPPKSPPPAAKLKPPPKSPPAAKPKAQAPPKEKAETPPAKDNKEGHHHHHHHRDGGVQTSISGSGSSSSSSSNYIVVKKTTQVKKKRSTVDDEHGNTGDSSQNDGARVGRASLRHGAHEIFTTRGSAGSSSSSGDAHLFKNKWGMGRRPSWKPAPGLVLDEDDVAGFTEPPTPPATAKAKTPPKKK